MNYRESERNKVVEIRNSFFDDPGGGEYKNKPRTFVLTHQDKNLWQKIWKDATKYFKENKIVWWPGSENPLATYYPHK